MLVKWRLMITSLPYVLLIMVGKYILSDVLDYKGMIDFSDVALVLSGGIFLIGFMLAGTMADYKESERLPAEVACTLETIEETLVLAKNTTTALELPKMRKSLFEVSESILNWLYKELPQEELYQKFTNFEATILDIDKAGLGGLASRLLGELNSLRKLVTRIGVISRTNFLSSGYALLEVLITAVVALLFISKFKSAIAEFVIIFFVSLIYIYMYRLIKDIDDPFEYSKDGQAGAAEVELFPITEYLERAKKRL